jgi:hypothetical protein
MRMVHYRLITMTFGNMDLHRTAPGKTCNAIDTLKRRE